MKLVKRNKIKGDVVKIIFGRSVYLAYLIVFPEAIQSNQSVNKNSQKVSKPLPFLELHNDSGHKRDSKGLVTARSYNVMNYILTVSIMVFLILVELSSNSELLWTYLLLLMTVLFALLNLTYAYKLQVAYNSLHKKFNKLKREK